MRYTLRLYGGAVALVLIGGLLRWAIEAGLGRDLAFIYFLPFMVLATLRGGVGPGVLVCLGSNLLTFWRVDGGHWTLRQPLQHLQPLVVSVAIDGMILWLCLRVRASQAAMEHFAAERDTAARNTESILSSITGCFFSLDNQYRFTYVNPEMLEYVKKGRSEMIGRDLWDVFPMLRGGEPERLVRHAMETREAKEIETPGLLRPQTAYEVKLCPSPLGLSVYSRDVTDRRRIAEALEAQDALLRLIAETAPVLIGYIDRDLRYRFVNPRYAEWFGRPIEEIRGQLMEDLWLPQAWEVVRPRVEAALAGESFEYEAELLDAQGRAHWMHAAYVPDRAPDGTIRGAVVAVVDETVRKSHEEEREALLASERHARAESDRANRIKDEFLATLSHELRTPLNAILGWAQLLRTGNQSDPEDLAQGLETIDRNARVQAQIIEDLLDMSRIISGKLRLQVGPIDLNHVLASAVESVRPAATAKGIAIHKSVDVPAGAVRGDAARLHQVLWNLLNNAIKFTPRSGSVTARARCEGADCSSVVIIEVSDTGQGIKPEFLPHVFERFRQGDATTTRQHGGLGLGLSIVKQLAEMHGGSVSVHSDGAGCGATFTVTLPIAVEDKQHKTIESPAAPVLSPAEIASNSNLQGVRVLIVDDELDARELFRRMLEDCHAQVQTASSASEGLQMLSVFCPDVLVSDIGMPGQDGYEFIRRVRSMGTGQDAIPAAALTAFARSEDRIRALVAGYQVHVPKPVQSAELVATVASLANRKPRGGG